MKHERLESDIPVLLIQIVGVSFFNFLLWQVLKFNLDINPLSSASMDIASMVVLAFIVNMAIVRMAFRNRSSIFTQLLVAAFITALSFTMTGYAQISEYSVLFTDFIEQGMRVLSAYDELIRFSLVQVGEQTYDIFTTLLSVILLPIYLCIKALLTLE